MMLPYLKSTTCNMHAMIVTSMVYMYADTCDIPYSRFLSEMYFCMRLAYIICNKKSIDFNVPLI